MRRDRATTSPLLAALSASARDAIYHEQGPDRLTRREFVEPLERLLLDGAADGSLRASTPRRRATVLFNVVGHTYTHLRSGTDGRRSGPAGA